MSPLSPLVGHNVFLANFQVLSLESIAEIHYSHAQVLLGRKHHCLNAEPETTYSVGEIQWNVLREGNKQEQVWYFISKNQPALRCSNPLKSSPGSHSLLVSNSVGITSSCSLLVFPLSVSLMSSRLRCLCFSVSILNS